MYFIQRSSHFKIEDNLDDDVQQNKARSIGLKFKAIHELISDLVKVFV